MTAWSFIATDGRPPSSGGGHLISAAAPYFDAKWVDGLDPGNLTCSFALDSVPDQDRIDYYDHDRTVIWPCADGTPVGAWIVTSAQPRQLGTGTVDIVAQPALWRILDGKLVRSTLIFQQVDQLDIARDLIRYATNQTMQHASPPVPFPKGAAYSVPWLRFAQTLSTRPPRDRLDNTDGWQAAARKTVGQCLRSLVELIDGFEVATIGGLDDDRMPYLEVRFGDPELGDPDIIGTLEWPSEAVTAGAYGLDGSDRASLLEAVSGGTGDANTLIAAAVDLPEMTRRLPREVAISTDGITVAGTLQARADAELAATGRALVGFALTLGGEQVQPYSFPWGSRFRLVVEDEGFPKGAEFTVRARGASFDAGGYGAPSTVNLDLQVM